MNYIAHKLTCLLEPKYKPSDPDEAKTIKEWNKTFLMNLIITFLFHVFLKICYYDVYPHEFFATLMIVVV